jgi:protein involved in polysaccharide export with SLBB domain
MNTSFLHFLQRLRSPRDLRALRELRAVVSAAVLFAGLGLVIGVGAGPGGHLAAQEPPSAPPATSDPPVAESLPPDQAFARETADVTLRPGDALRVAIWREPDLSGEFPVDESGVLVLPLLGRIPVAGIPLGELRETLYAEYEKQLRNPSILLTPLRRIYVLGEVHRPGPMAVDLTMSLGAAVAMAGGARPDGDATRLRVMRDGVLVIDNVQENADLISIDVRSGDQIFVGRRSWFERNTPFLISATIGLAGIIVSLVR